MKTNSRALLLATIIYIYLPVALYVIGFINPVIALITLAVMGYSCFVMFNGYAKNLERREAVRVKIPAIITGIIIITLICILIGFGGIFTQAGDWHKHNAVLHDLVERDWPVYYTKYEKSLLTYYLGQYIVPSLFGKLVYVISGHNGDIGLASAQGFMVARVFMAVWGIAGLVLVFLNLVRITRSKTFFMQMRSLVILLFFSGALPLAQIICNDVYSGSMYSLGAHHWLLVEDFMLQYRSNLVMLRWVYPQVIVVWLIVIMLLEHKDDFDSFVFLLLPIVLYGTFSIIIPVIVAFVLVVARLVRGRDVGKTLKKTFSLSNILTAATLGIILFTYFLGYMQVEKPEYVGFHIQEINIRTVWVIVIFCLCMFGIYSICIFKEQKRNIIYYVVNICLLAIPFFRMGLCNDWVMGASIPGLFIIMIYVIRLLNITHEGMKEPQAVAHADSRENDSAHVGGRVTYSRLCRSAVICCTLVIGMWYPLMEIKESVKENTPGNNIQDVFGTLERYSNRNCDDSVDLLYNYYTYDLQGKFFYEHLAKTKIDDLIVNVGEEQPCVVDGIYFDTYINIRAYDNTPIAVLQDALAMCEEYQNIFDRYNSESELFRINNRYNNMNSDPEGAYMTVISEDMFNILKLGEEYYESTDGAFNIGVGTLSNLWHFHGDSGYCLPSDDDVTLARESVDLSKVMVDGDGYYLVIDDDNLEFDLGGIAKGYIGNKLRDYLLSKGCKEAVISLGGNVICIGDKQGEQYTVGVQKPFAQSGETVDTLRVANTCVVTSGIYERFVEDGDKLYHHIIDPATGYPSESDIAGITVICEDSAKADALSTALLIMGSDRAMDYINSKARDVSAIIILRDGSVIRYNM